MSVHEITVLVVANTHKKLSIGIYLHQAAIRNL